MKYTERRLYGSTARGQVHLAGIFGGGQYPLFSPKAAAPPRESPRETVSGAREIFTIEIP